MRGAPAQLPDQGMAQGQGQQPSKLDELQGRLDQQAASSAIPADLNGVSVTDLKRKLSNLRSVKHLADGGAKQDAQCQNIEAEIRRRENPQNTEADIKRREDSHNWLNRVGPSCSMLCIAMASNKQSGTVCSAGKIRVRG